MLAVYLLEAGDWPGGQVPDGVEHVGGVDPVVICTFATEMAFNDAPREALAEEALASHSQGMSR